MGKKTTQKSHDIVIGKGVYIAQQLKEKLGIKLYHLREGQEKSLQVVSELMGLSPSTLQRLENGDKSARLENYCIAFCYYGVDINAFMKFDDEAKD